MFSGEKDWYSNGYSQERLTGGQKDPFILKWKLNQHNGEHQSICCIVIDDVLDLIFGMYPILFSLYLLLFQIVGGRLVISAPGNGEVVRGSIPIVGNIPSENFQSATLYFRYTDQQVDTWFILAERLSPVAFGTITTWESANITDGDYDIQLVVTLLDGTQQVVRVDTLRVRNYSVAESNMMTVQETAIPLVVDSVKSVIPSLDATPTSLPINPAELTTRDLTRSMQFGVYVMVGLVLFLVFWIGLRKIIRMGL